MNTKQVRLDLQGIHPNVMDSVLSVIDYDENGNIKRKSVIEAPLGRAKDIETEDIQDRFGELLFRCLNFTSKFYGIDELTGEKYDDMELRLYKLRNVKCINNHFCAGDIMYHSSNEYMLKWMDLMFWNKYNIIPKHNLQNIKVLRSNGYIEDAIISEDDAFRWSDKHEEYIIRVGLEGGAKEKCVKLSKIREYNSDLVIQIVLPHRDFYKECPEWVLQIYDKWIGCINLSSFEKKFELDY
tara:strand:+ start:149 stop:868 length:720 start_codon:yes stop_codon:yes gene_type:complete